MKGDISREFTVWCATCEEWRQEGGSLKGAIYWFKSYGWKKKRGVGWICPECLKRGAK